MLKDLFLSFTVPGWLLFLLVWICIFAGVLYYWRTIPPLSRFRRILLSALRSAVLTSVLFLLFQPVLHLVYQSPLKPTVAVLLDNSASMRIQDRNGVRSDSLYYILRHIPLKRLSDSLNIVFYRFDKDVHRWEGDSLPFDGKQTNIDYALRTVVDSLIDQNLKSIVLISDGQFNQGRNPLAFAEKSPVPIHTLAIGDSTTGKDVRITAVQAPRVTYRGQNVPVRLRLQQNLCDGEKVQIRLWQGKRLLQTRQVELAHSGFEQLVEMSFPAQKTGEFQFRVEVVPLPEEISTRNNTRYFLVRILKSRIRVLLLSGQPTFDQRLLMVALRGISGIELLVRTETRNGTFYEGALQKAQIDSQDVYLFLGYPTARTPERILQSLFENITTRKKPLFLLLTTRTSLSRLYPLAKLLPIIKGRIVSGGVVNVALTPGGQMHAVTRLDEDPARVSAYWSDLPPVTALGEYLKPRAGSQVLLTGNFEEGGGEVPVLLANYAREVKTLLLTVTDVGTWHLQLQDDPDRADFFQMFLEHAIKWLVNREDVQKVQIKPQQRIFRTGETVILEGEVFDDFYQPVNDAEVTLKITGENFQREDVIPYQEGVYHYELSGLLPGTYSYTVTARRGEQVLGTRRGKFVVELLELEMQTPRANPRLMRQIAHLSGGKSLSARHFTEALQSMRFTRRIRLHTLEWVLWHQLPWLIIVIGLLSVEWFFRKRWGLL